MTRRTRILGGIFGILAAAVLSLALVLSHDSECEAPGAIPGQATRMQAIRYRCYGSPEVPAAIAYLEQGRARGKVVIAVAGPGQAAH